MRDIILAIVILIIFVAVFLSKGKTIVYQPLQPQTIFDAESRNLRDESSTISVRQDKVVSFVPQVAGSQQTLPTFNIYTELYVPEKFVANVVKTKSTADYILVNEQLLQQKVIIQPTIPQVAGQQTKQITKTTQIVKSEKQSRKLQDKQQTQQITNETTEKSVQQKINVLNYQNIQNYVKQNPKTYFYPQLQTGKDVILSCVSFTPFENKSAEGGSTSGRQGILKFSIENKQKSFFFINTVSIETQDGQKLPIQLFAEQFVPPEETMIGYIVFHAEPKKVYNLVISSKNILKIQFSTPGGI
jgi:hypothetical protein